MLRIVVLAASASLLVHGALAAQTPPAGLRVLDVPYLSQSEQLCGGAAAAMLMRHAGMRGVYAEDFSALVSEAAGGIAAGALRRALVERGFDVQTLSGAPDLARRYLAAGLPVMALIEVRPKRFHYVVIVGWNEGAVVYHDPARAPFLAVKEATFDRAWAVADRWMLVARPADNLHRAPAAPARQVPTSGAHERALRAFENGNYQDAARSAEAAIAANAEDEEAWRLLAASLYLSGDADRALDDWNRVGEPRVDLVRLDGLFRTPHRLVEDLVDIRPASVLTRAARVRGERRLAMLPSATASRVSYIALPGGLAEVRGAVVESPLFSSRTEWLAEGVRAAIDRDIHVRVANAGGGGDRLTVAWRFRDLQPRVAARLAFPGRTARGIWHVNASWQREHYAPNGPPTTTRRAATIGWSDWTASRVRLSAEGGVARWEDRGTAALLGGAVEIAPLDDRWRLSLEASGAAAGPSFASTTVSGRWTEAWSHRWRATGTAFLGHVTSGAPPDAWFGAGSGQGRPLLLRAHSVLVDNRLAGPVVGRTLAQSTLELRREVVGRSLWGLDVAGFADTARAWRRFDGSTSPLHVDVGVGLRLRVGTGGRAVRVDVGRGLRDGEMGVSVGWEGAEI